MRSKVNVLIPEDVYNALPHALGTQRASDALRALVARLVEAPGRLFDLVGLEGSCRSAWSAAKDAKRRVTFRLDDDVAGAFLDLMACSGISDKGPAIVLAGTLLARNPAALAALAGVAHDTFGVAGNTFGVASDIGPGVASDTSGVASDTNKGSSRCRAQHQECRQRHQEDQNVGLVVASELQLEEEEEEDLLLTGLGSPEEIWREGCRLLGPARGPSASHDPTPLELGAMAIVLDEVKRRVKDPKARRGYGIQVWADVRTDPGRVRGFLADLAEASQAEERREAKRQADREARTRYAARRAKVEADVRGWTRARRAEEARRLKVAPCWISALEAPGENDLAIGELVSALAAHGAEVLS